MWSRRAFLASAGAGFLAGLAPAQAEALMRSELVFASAGKYTNGRFGAVLVNERGETIAGIELPDRGHDVTFSPHSGHLVVFARRPGTFAIVFDQAGKSLQTLTSVEGRHFFGHGEFSPDGRLLYATENDFGGNRGMVGIYDATDSYRRIGEFYSGGIGPHDVLISADGRHLCVANGGIETHPDFGRAKLNIATMAPNLAWLDRSTGDVVATHKLPQNLHQLSLRHLAIGQDGRLWVGAQYQGEATDPVPLLASAAPDEDLHFAPIEENISRRLAGYVGALGASADGTKIIATSPVGGAAMIHDVSSGKTELITLENVCGVAWPQSGLALSSGNGAFDQGGAHHVSDDFYFDHHMVTVSG